MMILLLCLGVISTLVGTTLCVYLIIEEIKKIIRDCDNIKRNIN